VLAFPELSVKTSEATLIVHAPSEAGEKVAVKTIWEVVEKVVMDPPVTEISSDSKSVVFPLLVNVSERVASFEVNPLVPSAAWIVIVSVVPGAVPPSEPPPPPHPMICIAERIRVILRR
jgi:hypothetical protein